MLPGIPLRIAHPQVAHDRQPRQTASLMAQIVPLPSKLTPTLIRTYGKIKCREGAFLNELREKVRLVIPLYHNIYIPE